jgi:hypothetical protein
VYILMSRMEEHHMSRLHRLVPTVAAALATAALLAPAAQARPAVSGGASGGGNPSAVERTVHEHPLANPVTIATPGLNEGTGVAGQTRSTRITSTTGIDWADFFSGAAASGLVIAMCAVGIGFSRRANPAT